MSFDASKAPYTSAFVKKTGVFIAMVETKKKGNPDYVTSHRRTSGLSIEYAQDRENMHTHQQEMDRDSH